MPSDYHLNIDSDSFSMSVSARPQPQYVVLDKHHCKRSTDDFTERIEDYARLLAPKPAKISIYLDHLPFEDEDHAYRAVVLCKERYGERKVLLEGEYKFSVIKSEAKRKALEDLLKKSVEKVKETIDHDKARCSGRWLFIAN